MPLPVDEVEVDGVHLPAPEAKPKPTKPIEISDTPFGIPPAQRAVTFDDADEISMKSETLYLSITARLQAATESIAAKRAEAFAVHSAAADSGDASFKRKVLKFANEKADEIAGEFAKSILTAGPHPVGAVPVVLQQLADIKARFANAVIANASPQSMLDAVGNDNPTTLERKIRLVSWLSEAGAAGIANFARSAMIGNDLIAMSAAARALEKMNPKLRPITPNALGERVFGAKFRALKIAADQIALTHERADLAYFDLKNGTRRLSAAKLEHALKQREIDKNIAELGLGGPAPAPTSTGPRTPLMKIADGVAEALKRKALI